MIAAKGGVTVSAIGEIVTEPGVRVIDAAGNEIGFATQGFDHFDRKY